MADALLQENESLGFRFLDGEDVALAKKEQKQIEFLDARMNYQNPGQILAFYNKLISDGVFKTPVGLLYLKKLQDYLIKEAAIAEEEIAPIPIPVSCSRGGQELSRQIRYREVQPAKQERSSNLILSFALNIALIIAVLAMFWVTMKTDEPNILNYKEALENRYAGWEEELSSREQAVREKEREWKIGEE